MRAVELMNPFSTDGRVPKGLKAEHPQTAGLVPVLAASQN